MNNQELEQWKAQHQSNLAQYAAENALNQEMFKSVILAGQTALKSCVIMNGGAAVALLAFIGSVWNKSTDIEVLKLLLISMILYVAGVLCGVVASGLTYLGQTKYAEQKMKSGNIIRGITISIVIISYLVFLAGSVLAFCAFWEQLPKMST